MTTTSTRRATTGGTGKATRAGKAAQSTKGTRAAHTAANATGSRGGTSRPKGGRTSPTTAAPPTNRRSGAPKAAHATGAANRSIGTTDTGHGGSDEQVRVALSSAGGQTVEQLAAVTGLGKSTVAKALVRLETAGQATRSRGTGTGRTRQPDQWNPAASTAGRRRQPTGRTAPATAGRTQAETTPATTDPATTGAAKTVTKTAAAKTAAAKATAGRLGAGTRPKAGERNLATNTVKLAPGDLTRLVADHFAANPNTVLTPGEVGRSLGRSPGAVRNAADKLTREGALRRLEGAPRRYTTAD
jgi:trimeric autotransporter adhesin